MEASGLVPQAQGQLSDQTAKKPERIFAAVLLGQLLSFLLALTSLISALLASKVASASHTMSDALLNYNSNSDSTATRRRTGVQITLE